MIAIRPAASADLGAMRAIFDAVVAAGDSYVFEAPVDAATHSGFWFGAGMESFVAEEDGCVLGMYRLNPNQRDRGDHVANAAFMVAPAAAGRGIGRRLGEHCLERARAVGFRAMQFNFVVASNRAAVALWQSLGFAIVGTLPGAFRHARLGYVDALVMYRALAGD